MSLLGPAEIRDLAELLGIQPTKKLGQNFVIDANTVRRIVRTAGVSADATVVEVGPGLGSLTLGLLETGAAVVAVEIDKRLAAQLPLTVAELQPSADLTVVTADAMTITELPGDPTVLVANLPYNVSVPVLLHFLEHFPRLERGLVMVQAEVGQRLAAPPGSEGLRFAQRQGGLVRLVAHRRAGQPPGVLARAERRLRCSSPSSGTTRPAPRRNAVPPSRSSTQRSSRDGKCCGRRLPVFSGTLAAASARIEAAGLAPTARGEELTVLDFLAIARAFGPASGEGANGGARAHEGEQAEVQHTPGGRDHP